MRHHSDQKLSPELHRKLEREFLAQTHKLLAKPFIPNPRYELQHRPAASTSGLPPFTLTFHAANPSAARNVAHTFAERLNIALEFLDKYTTEATLIRPASTLDD